MGNPNAPFGLRAIKHMKGGVIRFNDEYTIASGYGTQIVEGDPVLAVGTDANIGIAVAGTNNKITGIFAGCEFVDASGDTKFLKYWPAGQVTKGAVQAKAWVYDDPDILWEVMFDTLAAADIRALANLASAAGDILVGRSGWSAVAPPGAGENQLKIVRLSKSAVNPGGVLNAFGAFAVAQVLINQHEFASGTNANL